MMVPTRQDGMQAFVEQASTHRTVRAFSMVSAVVKVLETITTSVVSCLRPFRARATSTGSTLARKRRFLPFACTCASHPSEGTSCAALTSEAMRVLRVTSKQWRITRGREGAIGMAMLRSLHKGPTSSAAVCSVRRAVWTKRGPRKEPPMPMATTSVSAFPVAPSQVPLRTLSVKVLILSSTCQTSGTTSAPSVYICCTTVTHTVNTSSHT